MKIHEKLSALLNLLAHPDALHYNADGSEAKDLNEVYEDWVGAGKPVVETGETVFFGSPTTYPTSRR